MKQGGVMMVTAKLLYCDSSSISVVTTAVDSVYFYKAMGQGWGSPFSSTARPHTPQLENLFTTMSAQAFPSICQKVGFAFPRREGLRRGSVRLASLLLHFPFLLSFCHSVRVTHLSQYRARCEMGHMYANYAHGIPPGIP